MISRTPITWIPEHPSYGSISMFRYWQFLAAECRAEDRYDCTALIPLPDESAYSRKGVVSRAWGRKVDYPLRLRFLNRSGFIHILDHSWAEMMDFFPHGTRSIVTIHDLIPLRDPGDLSVTELARFQDRVSRLRKADALIAVSEYTRNEAIDLLQIPPNRIHVVPNGVNAPRQLLPTPILRPNLRIGSVGSTLTRKNLAILPPALSTYRSGALRPPLFIRAGDLISNGLRMQLHSALGDQNFQELGRISESQLEEFYASIDVLVIPSHYEGFGLPVLEAMARGVPVIAARSSSLPEVGGDAALYFDPNDPEELAQRLHEVADPTVAKTLRVAGLARSAEFSWRRTLEGFFTIYDKLLT